MTARFNIGFPTIEQLSRNGFLKNRKNEKGVGGRKRATKFFPEPILKGNDGKLKDSMSVLIEKPENLFVSKCLIIHISLLRVGNHFGRFYI